MASARRARQLTAHRGGVVLGVVDGSRSRPDAGQAPHETPAGHRVAVVTGGDRGFGLALVQALAQRGTRVVMAARSVDRGRAALDLLGDLAGRVAVRQLDVTDQDSVARLAWWLDRQLGRCDALVNNAAVLIDDERGSPEVDMDVVRQTLDTNLVGTWRLVQAVTPLMRRHHHGRIVNISSELGSLTPMGPGLPAYRISRTAINALTRILAADLAGDGILVNACCPGPPDVNITVSPDAIEFAARTGTVVWLATLPADGPTGGFFRNGSAIGW